MWGFCGHILPKSGLGWTRLDSRFLTRNEGVRGSNPRVG
jgi:hypothetical protein